MINMAYNNPHHFSTELQHYDVLTFLEDMYKICESVTYKVIVMGGQHVDTGHVSRALFQVDDFGTLQYLMVQDTYIRFKVECSNERFTKVLQPNRIYHYLTRPPRILWLSMHPRSVWNEHGKRRHTIYPLFDNYLRKQLNNRLPVMVPHISLFQRKKID